MVMESADDSASPGSRKRPRLFIQEMVMRNFKSYAGEQRVGPFHKVKTFFLKKKKNILASVWLPRKLHLISN